MVQDWPVQGHTHVPSAVLSVLSGLLSSIRTFTFVRGWAASSGQVSRIPRDPGAFPGVLPGTGEACMPRGRSRFPAHTLPGTAGLESRSFSSKMGLFFFNKPFSPYLQFPRDFSSQSSSVLLFIVPVLYSKLTWSKPPLLFPVTFGIPLVFSLLSSSCWIKAPRFKEIK